MVARILFLATLAGALLGGNLRASAQRSSPHLQAGDLLPSLSGQSLLGNPVEFPSAAGGQPTIVLFSFSRAGGQRVQDWIHHLSKEMPDIGTYSMIFLEAIPGPFRSVVVSRIKSSTPKQQQSRTLLLNAEASAWKQQLQTCIAEDVCILLLGSDSHIRWMTGGAFSRINDQALESELKSIGR